MGVRNARNNIYIVNRGKIANGDLSKWQSPAGAALNSDNQISEFLK